MTHEAIDMRSIFRGKGDLLSFQIGLALIYCPSCSKNLLVPVRELASNEEIACSYCSYPLSVHELESKDADLARILSIFRSLRL
jgi:DNA-directed RNA polymerase subunit RPC12/RpoP